MNLQEVIKWLGKEKLVEVNKGVYKFTRKFYEEKGKLSYQAPVVQLPPVVKDEAAIIIASHDLYSHRYINFIIEAQVPARLTASNGTQYTANEYNEKAAMRFHRLIESKEANYDFLVKSTMLYYKGGAGFKQKITSYILDGTWKTEYIMLVQAAADGTIEEHLITQLDNGEHDPYAKRK